MGAIQEGPSLSKVDNTLWSMRRDTMLTGAVLAILALALGLRLFGLDWDRGFPYTPHPDERAILMRVDAISPPTLGELDTLFDADESPWNPHWFPYGSFPLYLLKGVQLVSSFGPGDGLTDLRVTGRAISALADLATIVMVFLLGCRVYGRRVGLLASLLAALAVIHIQLSHFFAVDTLVALFTIVAVFFLVRVAREGRTRDSVLAGGFIALALATKVSMAPILGAYVIAHLMYAFSLNGVQDPSVPPFGRRWSSAAKGLVAGGVTSLAVLFVVQPYTFLDWSTFYGDVTEQSEMVRRIRDYPYTRQYIDTTPYLYQIRQLATWGLGWPLGIVAWAGLMYASLRGLRLRPGLAYLLAGWGLPIAILLYSTSFPAIFVASGVALLALLATLPPRKADSRMDVLLLSWVVPLFLITGAFQVKFLRYLLPMIPFLLLFGSRMLFAVWDRVGLTTFKSNVRPWLVAGAVLLVGSTAFYAFSYVSVYGQTHTAVRAAEWINENVPKGAVILKEHWDEGLPNLVGYQVRELSLYDPDSQEKVRSLSEELAKADFLVLFSNRLYGTIPRLPERYPITSAYYDLLFTGGLGYELADFEATYPEFLGVGFVDDTFGRSGVPEPDALRAYDPSSVNLDLGFADESFSVYDHPKVIVLENVGRLDGFAIQRAIQTSAPSDVPSVRTDGSEKFGLMMSAEEAAAQRRGGTWTDIVRPDSWASRLPVLAWLIAVEGVALLALPITFAVFRPLADRGYLFSKVLGLLSVGLIVWLLASLRWMVFSRASIVVGLLVLGGVALAIAVRNRRELADFVRRRWRLLLIVEAVFLAAFFSFLLLRMANPDLWHPFRGGEKPMDLAYLNAVLRSSYMPPYDPWFGGGYLNYYYWGQFTVATLIRATGIDPTVAFNLAVPLFFALTAGGAFTVVYNLAEGTRRRLLAQTIGASTSIISLDQEPAEELSPGHVTFAHPEPVEGRAETRWPYWSPVLAGIGGALFVTVMGNLDGAIQLGQSVWRAAFRNLPFGEFDFWQSSRMMPTSPEGITEFPFFTFLFADLHAHLMALPFTLLVLGLALAVVMASFRRGDRGSAWSLGEIGRLAVLGVAVGTLWLVNAWDLPTYLMIAVAAVFLAEFFAHGGLGLLMVVRAGIKSLAVLAVGYLVFLPFHLSYETFNSGVETTTNTTVLWRFLAISGLFVFVIGSYFVYESRDWLMAAWRGFRHEGTAVVQAVSGGDPFSEKARRPVSVGAVIAVVVGALLVGFILTAIFSGAVGSTVPFVAVLLALVFFTGLRWLVSSRADSPQLVFVAVIVAVSLSLAIGLDIYRVEGDIDRMNSIFKFYLQIWVMLGLASAYLLWRFAHGRRLPVSRLAWGKKVWLGALALLILSAAVYPVLGTQDRLRDRFNGRTLQLTLDGTAYAEETVYRDRQGDIDLAADLRGVQWLRDNVQGSPIVLEGVTPTYRWGSRISIYTGLPTVVGWKWHQEQQRWDYRSEVGRRISDVETIYRTTNATEALSLMDKYGVRYVYVGRVERLYYRGRGLEKFDGALSEVLDKVFETDQVAIYRLRDTGF